MRISDWSSDVCSSDLQAAALCSTGEQKALLLSIILAHAELVARRMERRPVLLLDEVAAHLDPARRCALFERLAAGGGQVWMTGTETGLFAELGAACRLHVSAGRRSEEHTSELQSLMRISYAVFCLKKKKKQ